MQIGTLVKAAKIYLPSLNEERLRGAYTFARNCHKGQLRMDGSPYIIHPLAAAMNLTKLKVDEDALVACLLHDVPEDTTCTLDEIEKNFGKNVAFLVDGVTKLSKVKYRDNMAERQIESLKKFFLHSAQDLRIILIKLADRLHNMETLQYVKKEKQLRIAKETMEIFAPIANLLGIWGFKAALEDLCFQFIYPEEYKTLSKQMEVMNSQHEKLLRETLRKVKRALKTHNISADVESRPKNLFSIFSKMVRTGRQLEDLHDLLGLRIIVEDEPTCYQVLGIVHSLFHPKSGRIKDYIAVPKSNGYQSLHTTVFGLKGLRTEFQIRTHAMHMDSEYGIAAHYFYQSQGSKSQEKIAKRSEWVQRILDLQKELKSNYDFLENLKVDVFQDRIFVFTPKGDVIDLPRGATGLDFAYHIHSDVGNHAIKLIRNNVEAPLFTTLKTGDTVEVTLSKTQNSPQRKWLEKVRTNIARNKIRQAIKRQSTTQWRTSGRELLKYELGRYGADTLSSLTASQKATLINHFEVKDWNDLLESMGEGTISGNEIIATMYSVKDLLGEAHKGTTSKKYKTPLSQVSYRKGKSRLFEDLRHRPGIPYHRVKLHVDTTDRVGMLRDLGMSLANIDANIYQIGVHPGKTIAQACIELVLEVIDIDHLRLTFDAIESVDGVVKVYRVSGKSSKKARS
jgi:GTP diphosphokinase / guanosine-3',5'-bis(diphosphate) 3'-diphosphatase